MSPQELRNLAEAALVAKYAREHARETSARLLNDPDMSKHDLAVAVTFASQEAERRLDAMLDAYARKKQEAIGA